MSMESVTPIRNSGFEPEVYVPRKKPGATLYDRGPSEPAESRYLLSRENGEHQLALSDSDKLLWDMFDGRSTVNDVCQQYLGRHRTLVLTRLYSLIHRLWEEGFLESDPMMASGAARLPAWRRVPLYLTGWCRMPVPGSARLASLVGRLPRHLPLGETWAMLVGIVAIIAGICLFSNLDGLHDYPLIRLSQTYILPGVGVIPPSYVLGFVLLLLLHLVASFIHQLSRGAMQAAYTYKLLGEEKAEGMSLAFNYLIPVFQHRGTWVAVLPMRYRLLVGGSGICAELLLAALCSLLLTFNLFQDPLRELLYKFVYILYLRAFLHFSPFSGSEFTWLMRVLSDIRNFRRKAFGFLRYSLATAFRGETRLAVEHKFYLAFNLVAAFWLGLAAAFIFSLMMANQYVLNNLIYVWNRAGDVQQHLYISDLQTVVSSDLAILSEERYFVMAIVVLGLLLLLGSLIASCAWGGFVVWKWLRDLPVWRRPTVLIGCGLGAIIVFLGFLHLLSFLHLATAESAVHYLHWATILLGVIGALLLIREVMREGWSYLTARTICLALAMLLSTSAMVLENHVTQNLHLARNAHAVVLALLVIGYLIGLAAKLHPIAFRKTRLLLPELTVFVGSIVLGAAAWRGLRGNPLLLAHIDNNRFVGMALIVIGSAVILRVLRDLDVPLESFAIDMSRDTPEQSLKRILANVMETLAQLLSSKFGEHGLEAIEKRVNRGHESAVFGFSSLFVPEESTPEEIGAIYRGRLLEVQRTVGNVYGHLFATQAMDRVFRMLHWECKLMLEQYLLPGSPWENRYRAEAELDSGARIRLINAISMFTELSTNERQLLARHSILCHYPAGELIVRQGDFGDTCYIVIDGEVQVEERDSIGEHRLVAFLMGGDFFGETALLEHTPRVASVRAAADTRLLALRRDDFDKFTQYYPEMVHRIRDRLYNLQTLLRIPLFGDLPTTLLRTVLPRVRAMRFEAGTDIIMQGDIGKEFYLIKSGRVNVIAIMGDQEEGICELGPREYFGEIALLKDIPRTATVRAAEHTELLVLEKDDFFQLIRGSRLFAHSLQVVGEERLATS